MSKLTASIYAAVVIIVASLAAVSAFLAAAAGQLDEHTAPGTLYPPDLQEEAVKTAFMQSELLYAD